MNIYVKGNDWISTGESTTPLTHNIGRFVLMLIHALAQPLIDEVELEGSMWEILTEEERKAFPNVIVGDRGITVNVDTDVGKATLENHRIADVRLDVMNGKGKMGIYPMKNFVQIAPSGIAARKAFDMTPIATFSKSEYFLTDEDVAFKVYEDEQVKDIRLKDIQVIGNETFLSDNRQMLVSIDQKLKKANQKTFRLTQYFFSSGKAFRINLMRNESVSVSCTPWVVKKLRDEGFDFADEVEKSNKGFVTSHTGKTMYLDAERNDVPFFKYNLLSEDGIEVAVKKLVEYIQAILDDSVDELMDYIRPLYHEKRVTIKALKDEAKGKRLLEPFIVLGEYCFPIAATARWLGCDAVKDNGGLNLRWPFPMASTALCKYAGNFLAMKVAMSKTPIDIYCVGAC